MGCIYILWNTVNNKVYVGQTKHDTPENRIAAHLARNSEIAKDVEKYGNDAFKWGILYENIPTELLDHYKVKGMQAYDTVHPNGYNKNRGPVKLQHKYNPKLLPPFVKGIEKYAYSEQYDEEYEEEVVYDETYQDYVTNYPWTDPDDGQYPRKIYHVTEVTHRIWKVYDEITEAWYTIYNRAK